VTVAAIDQLIAEFAKLPGIGRKTAQRLTFHLLQQSPEQARRLAAALSTVAEQVRPCRECGNPTEEQPCAICADPRRDASLLCVVEEASAVTVVERATGFRGRYHVLGGRLSPLDGVGPEALRLDRLVERVREGAVREVILAYPGVHDVHDLHVWTLGAGNDAITAHVRAKDPAIARALSRKLRESFETEYVTVQVELTDEACGAPEPKSS